jgi:hypothetical protein
MSSNDNSDVPKNNASRRDFFRASTRLVGAPAQELSKTTKIKRVLGRHNSTSGSMSRRTFVKVAAAGAAVAGLVLAAPKILPGVTADSKNTKSLNYKGKVTTADRLAAAAARPNGTAAPTVVPAQGGTPDYFGTTPNYANSPMPTVGAPAPGAGVVLTGFALQSGGSSYTTPAVVLTGGGGTGATATARVSNGVILGLVLTNPGTAYTSAPTVTIRDPSPRAKGAAATLTTSSTVGVPTITGGIHKFVDSLPQLNTANNLGQMLPIAVADTTTYPGSDYYIISLRQ